MPVTPVSLARTVEEKRQMGKPMTEGTDPADMEDYPYGLCIHLSTSELRKLGFARGQLNPGDKVNLSGTGMITQASAEMVNSLESHTATLQIQSLGVEKQEEAEKPSDTIYGAKS